MLIFLVSKDTILSIEGYTYADYLACQIIFPVVALTLISQCFWGGYVLDIMAFFCRSFTMPSVIFSFDLDGILSLIFIKITLAVLSVLLSIIVFIIGVVIAGACSVVTFVFAFIHHFVKVKSMKEQIRYYARSLEK